MKNVLIIILLSFKIVYSQNNYISLNEDLSDLSVLDSAIKNHNVFLLGENHTYRQTNALLEFKTLKYLHQKENVRILLLEFGSAASWLVNKYFETGDEKILTKIKNTTHGSFSNLFKNIYEYNQSLTSNKIIAEGIDVEFNYNIALNVLGRLIPENKKAHDSISETIEVINFINGYLNTLKTKREEINEFYFKTTPDYFTKNTLDKVIINFENNTEAYTDLLESNYPVFKDIIEGVKQAIEWREEEAKKTPYSKVLRENYMHEKFGAIFNKYPEEKFFGQFGRAHTAKEKQEAWSGLYNFSPVAARINNDNRFSVFSIGIYYPQFFKTYKHTYQEGNRKKEFEGMSLVKDKFEDIPQDSILLYPLAKEDTFFLNKFNYLLVVNKDMSNEELLEKDSNNIQQYEYVEYGGIEYAQGIQDVDLKQYNDYFFDSSFKFDSPLKTHKIEFYYLENSGTYVGYSFLWYERQKTDLNDSTKFSLGGYKIGMSVGGDVIPNKRVHLIPQVGFSFKQLKTKVTQEKENNSKFFKTEVFDVEKITNRAFVIDLKTSLKVTLFNFLALGAEGGYQFDISSKYWKHDGKKITDLKTNYNGYFLMFSAGFAF